MIVLDTNIVSEAGRPKASRAVESWLAGQDYSGLYVTGITLMEISYGAVRFFDKTGSRRHHILLESVSAQYAGRILELSDPAPVICGEIRAERDGMGRPISIQDAMIAAICRVNGATLATRNVRDFEGLGLHLVNPFEPG